MDTLTTLFTHHRWANLRLLEACVNLSPEQLEASIPGSFSTLIETLRHIVTSEQSYFARISTGQPYPRPADEAPLTMAEMADSIRITGDGLIAWAGNVRPEETIRYDWDGSPRDVPKTIVLTQVINHATEHREQIKAIMTSLGIEPPDLQSWGFYDEDYRRTHAG